MTDIVKFNRNGAEKAIGDSKARQSIANEFNTSTNYSINDLVIYDGLLYKFIADHNAGAWDSSQVELATISEAMVWKSGDTMTGNLSVKHSGSAIISTCNSDLAIGTSPSSDTWVGGLEIKDKNNILFSYVDSRYLSTGDSELNIVARNRNGNSNVDNRLRLTSKPDGTKTVSVSDPEAWRTALGSNTDGIWQISLGGTGASDVINARKNLGYLGMFFAESVNADECISIPVNTNLNTPEYVKTGKYFCSSNARVATFTNCPTTIAFQMLIFNLLSTNTGELPSGSWNSRTRFLVTYQGNIFISFVTRDTDGTYGYGAWRKVDLTQV